MADKLKINTVCRLATVDIHFWKLHPLVQISFSQQNRKQGVTPPLAVFGFQRRLCAVSLQKFCYNIVGLLDPRLVQMGLKGVVPGAACGRPPDVLRRPRRAAAPAGGRPPWKVGVFPVHWGHYSTILVIVISKCYDSEMVFMILITT